MKKLYKFGFLISLLFIGMTNANALAKTCVRCGDGIEVPALLPSFVSKLVLLLQLAVPIILIVTGSIRYAKAVLSGDDKVIKETNSSFIKSIIAAIVIFLSIAIVKFSFNLFDQADTDGDGATNSCIKCFIKGDCASSFCTSRDGGVDSSGVKSCADIANQSDCLALDYCNWGYNNSSSPSCYYKH